MSDVRVELSTALQEVVEGNRGVSGRLVDDRCFVSDVVHWDDGVDAVTFDDLLLNDWLSNVAACQVSLIRVEKKEELTERGGERSREHARQGQR